MSSPKNWSVRLRPLWLYAVALGCLAIWFCSHPPTARPITDPPEVFSAQRAMLRLERLLQGQTNTPRVVGSEPNAVVADRLFDHFEELGLFAEIHRERVCNFGRCAEVRNILAYHPDVLKHDKDLVMLSAHHDSVGAGPGVSDDLASVAAMLEVAATRKAANLEGKGKNDVLYFVSDGEETGLFGAEAIYEHSLSERVKVVVNLEARGTRGRSFIFEAARAPSWLLDRAAYALSAPAVNSLAPAVYERLPNGSDLHVHREHAKPGVNFGYFAEVAHYHTPLDDLEHLSLDSLQHQGQNAAEMVNELTSTSLQHLPEDRAVYFDVLGHFVLKWPEPWSSGLALFALLILAVVALTGHRLGLHAGVGVQSLIGQVFKPLLYLFLMALVLLIVHWGTGEVVDDIFFWRANRELVVWMYGLLTILMFCGFHAFESEWMSNQLWFGNWLFLSLLGVLTALLLPAVSYVFIAPCVLAAVMSPIYGKAPRAIAALTALCGACVWLPLLWSLIDGLELLSSLLVGVPVSLLMLSLMPLTSEEGWGRKPGFWAGMIWMIVASMVYVLVFPSASPERPVGANIYIFESLEGGQAQHYLGMMPMDMLGRGAEGTDAFPDTTRVGNPPRELGMLRRGVHYGSLSDRGELMQPVLTPLGSLESKSRTQPIVQDNPAHATLIQITSRRDAPVLMFRSIYGARIFWLPYEASGLDNDALYSHLREHQDSTSEDGGCFGWRSPCLEIKPGEHIFAPYGRPLRVLVDSDISEVELEVVEFVPGVPEEVVKKYRGPLAVPMHTGDQRVYVTRTRVNPSWYGPK